MASLRLSDKSRFYSLIAGLSAEYERVCSERCSEPALISPPSSPRGATRVSFKKEKEKVIVDLDGSLTSKIMKKTGEDWRRPPEIISPRLLPEEDWSLYTSCQSLKEELDSSELTHALTLSEGRQNSSVLSPRSRCATSSPARSRADRQLSFGHQGSMLHSSSITHSHMENWGEFPVDLDASRAGHGTAYFKKFEWTETEELANQKLLDDGFDKVTRSQGNFVESLIEKRQFSSNSASHITSSSNYRRFRDPQCMIYPTSRIRGVWGAASIVLLAYDLAMVPVDVCFEMDLTFFAAVMAMVSRVFWTVDIPMQFLLVVFYDGRLVTRPRAVAILYLKSWFTFDVSLVSVEWWAMWMAYTSKDSNTASSSMLRTFRWSRMARFLRLVRLIKVQKIKAQLRGIVIWSSPGLTAAVAMMKSTFILVVGLHLVACLWHLIGNSFDDGWVRRSGLETHPVSHRYAMSLHWLFVHIQSSDGIQIGSTFEYLCDSLVYLCSFLLTAHYIAAMTNMVITFATSNVSQVRRIAKRYVRRHALSYEDAYRIEQCLTVNQFGGPVETVAEEHVMFSALPTRVQIDIQFCVRVGITQELPFFSDMLARTPRVLRNLTHRMNVLVVAENEAVFAPGDVCVQMFFITEGRFFYECSEKVLAETPRRLECPRRTSHTEGVDSLRPGDIVSEPVLWTTWEHHGQLASGQDTTLLCLDAAVFAKEVTAHERATLHAVKYAKHFLWRMNRVAVCDVMGFDLSLSELDSDLHIGSAEDHLVFLSHYKLEAGTEATLLRNELEAMIHRDPANPAVDFLAPVFLDSEDLFDLSRLMNHARGSLAIIVLLTPGIFTRPWVLLEIVTARRFRRACIPVIFHKQDFRFEFPDEEFYKKLHRDEILSADGRRVLEDNGTTVEEVEEAIRSISKMIALPFSPHKSVHTRETEVSDILKRIMVLTGNALRELGRVNSASSSSYHSDPCAAEDLIYGSSNASKSEAIATAVEAFRNTGNI